MLHNLSSSPSPKQIIKYGGAITVLRDAFGSPPAGISPDHWAALEELVSNEPETT
jgi:hypothetical protein